MSGYKLSDPITDLNILTLLDPDELPCYRDDFDGETWQCVNDHTGCIWNDGNNGCNAPGVNDSPLEEFEADQC